MELSWLENLLQNKRTVWIVGTLAILLFLVTNLPWQLDDYDQAKQAFTSFEMIKEGHWFYQHTPQERVATKPPLVGWVSAGLFALTRSGGEAAAYSLRSPSRSCCFARRIQLMDRLPV
jgi:4-amino-4-deoxy-L-arabinose transferase-like glycosyltransferase